MAEPEPYQKEILHLMYCESTVHYDEL